MKFKIGLCTYWLQPIYGDKGAIEISEATQNAIKYIIKAPAKKIFSFNISEENIYQLKLVSKIYLNNKLEKEYKL